MARSLVLGNGNILVCLDNDNRIRDFYYPFVGQENHVSGHHHRTGVWVDGKFSWISDSDWKLEIKYKKDCLISSVKAINHSLQIELDINECVHFEKNILVRQVKVKNLSSQKREVRIFFNQHFHILEANIGDTVYYTPELNSIINYKGKRYFLISGLVNDRPFQDYATGVADVDGKEGTYIDAEDGILSKNPIEHGSVDSTFSFNFNILPNQTQDVYYWITVGEKFMEVKGLNEFVLKKKPEKLIEETEAYWKKWVNKQNFDFCGLDPKIIDLFKRSMLIVRAQTDNGGAVIAASDTDTFFFKKDTYNYMWPRDGALVARSFDKVGHQGFTQRFFRFCSRAASDGGYLLHKYRPDGSFGSSWHPWVNKGKLQLPIQEDETALLLDALWKWYSQYKDKSFAKEMYSFIKKAGDFIESFRHKSSGLPRESYDLWEEKLGIHTFTCCTVYAGLEASKNFAKVFNKPKDFKKYEKAAKEVKEAIIKYLYDKEQESFIKGMFYDDKGNIVYDKTVDISTGYGIFEYKVLDVNDPRVASTLNLIENKLSVRTPIGGIARYEHDSFHKRGDNVPGNPWFISTLWLAEYYIAKAKNQNDLKKAKEILEWVVQRAMPSGVLPEQINPYTGEPLSLSPLTWSHAAYIIAVIKYLDKLEAFGICEPYLKTEFKNIKPKKKGKKKL